MTAINDAYQELLNRVPGVDRYFKRQITGRIDESKTDLIIRPLTGSYEGYGSDLPTKELQEIEVQVFIGLHSNSNLETITNSIVSFLLAKNWRVTYGPDQGTDPETGEVSLTLYFQRKIERKIDLWN